jgi:transforming growth factor-beta-induced protein
MAAKDIVDTAVANGSFKVLAAALTKTELIATLKGAGPFTVLAPNDAAFAKIDAFSTADKINAITDPATIAALKTTLLYHVIGGVNAPASVVTTLTSAKTAAPNGVTNGFMYVRVSVDGASVKLFPTKDLSAGAPASADPGSSVIATDVKASNGVIHVIDTVLIPPSKDIVGAAQSYPALSKLVAALGANSLVAPLQGAGPFTVFAPANSAAAWGAETADILTHHVTNVAAPGSNFLTSGDVVKTIAAADKTLPTLLAGKSITIGGTAMAPTIRGAKADSTPTTLTSAGTTDIVTKNGIVHVINEVLLP